VTIGITAFITGAAMATIGLLALPSGVQMPRVHGDASALTGPDSAEITSFGQLVSLVPDDLVGVDIARLNLLATDSLPGAENVKIEDSLAELDRWAARVRSETDRHLYKYAAAPANYEKSEAYFRVLMLITVLQQDLGVHYNPDRINDPDFTNSQDLFINGMIGSDNGGTCASMPVLYVAVGRRLGYPLKLVVTKGHIFARWEDERERFNIDGAGRGFNMHSDEFYTTWPYKLTEAEINNDWFLRSLPPAEELAVFLMQRGHCFEDTGQMHEAQNAYALAHRFAPKSPEGLAYLAALIRKESASGRDVDFDALAEQLACNSQQEWMKQKRREAEEIARRAVERAPGPVGDSPVNPRMPTPSGPVIPGTPSFPNGGS
jgi:tetratricopeptide (TPR) repeat protein